MKLNNTSTMGTVALLLGLLTASASADILYAANYGDGTIEKFSSDGTGSSFASTGTSITGLAFDSAGNLYVSYYSANTIEQFSLEIGAARSARTQKRAKDLLAQMSIR